MASSSFLLARSTSGTVVCRLKSVSYFSYVCNLKAILKPAASYVNIARCLYVSASTQVEKSTLSTNSTLAPPKHNPAAEKQLSKKEREAIYRELYIPISRQSLIRQLTDEKDLLTEEEKVLLPSFVRSLDTILFTKYQGYLEELKTLFDPINPDKDTQRSRELTRKEKLDSEFWLLHQLEDVMIKANFRELPKKKVEHFLRDHEAQEGVRVSVDPSRYDVLRFWVLGHDIPELKPSLPQKISNVLLRRGPAKPKEYFRRVVVALRLKKDSKLILKAFKEVPVQSLEMLLPDGVIRMRAIDQSILVGSTALTSFGVLGKLVTVLASLHVDWTLGLAFVTGALGFRMWSSYRNRRNAYLLDMSRTLYFKNIANNRGLLTLLVDRAEDESLKEALLTYIFLLKPSTRKSPGLFAKFSSGGLTSEELDSDVEKWLEQTTGTKIAFDSSEAIKLLQSLGLIIESDKRYQVLQLDVACRLLPVSPHSAIVQRKTFGDVADGFKDEYLENDDKYKLGDVKARQFGWI